MAAVTQMPNEDWFVWPDAFVENATPLAEWAVFSDGGMYSEETEVYLYAVDEMIHF